MSGSLRLLSQVTRMNWLARNLGLAALGMCILASTAVLDARLESLEQKVDAALSRASAADAVVRTYAAALPSSALR